MTVAWVTAAWLAAVGAWGAAGAAVYSATVARRAAREARASVWQTTTLTKLAEPKPAHTPSIGPLGEPHSDL